MSSDACRRDMAPSYDINAATSCGTEEEPTTQHENQFYGIKRYAKAVVWATQFDSMVREREENSCRKWGLTVKFVRMAAVVLDHIEGFCRAYAYMQIRSIRAIHNMFLRGKTHKALSGRTAKLQK
ncbi:hypothetical protein VTN00DRAFT_5982 [Thermoascus crustaceus]|uniref:uncharacterized protein n=1 Tax=Thermoascus crustaceus TaxID=5088 RepID=UPI0037440FF4